MGSILFVGFPVGCLENPAYLSDGVPLHPLHIIVGPRQGTDCAPPQSLACLCEPPQQPCPPPPLPPPGTGRWKAHLRLSASLQIFGDYYHFWHRAVTKRSLSPHRPRHSRLQREPQVSVALALPAATHFCSESALTLQPPHLYHLPLLPR